jgi:cytochrome oxidase Cu insertion factor (SCO1/SenC/PrrC family)
MNKMNLVIAFFAVFALVIGMKLWHHSIPATQPSGLSATVISPPKDVAKFSLVDSKGKPFNTGSLWAHWTFIVFGSASHCNESCAETMKSLNQVIQILQSNKQTPIPQVIFISTDSVNDSLDTITKFTAKYNPNFNGVTGDAKQVALLTQLIPANQKETVLLIDPAGKLSGIFTRPHHPETMVKDFKIIVQNEG